MWLLDGFRSRLGRWQEWLAARLDNAFVIWAAMPVAWVAVMVYRHANKTSGLLDALLPPTVSVVCPVPVAWLLLLRLVRADMPIRPVLTVWPAVSLGAFSLAEPGRHGGYSEPLLWLGMVTACVAFVPLRPVRGWIKRNPGPPGLALFVALSAKLFTVINHKLWFTLCTWTGQLISGILGAFRDDVYLKIVHSSRSIELYAVELFPGWKPVYYSLKVYEPCSGLEGVFLFVFLLSAAVLFDYRLFRKKTLAALYAIGSIYILIFNSLRILMLFVIAEWAWRPAATPFAQSMRGWPIEMFHSYSGLTLYLIAFWLFSGWVYGSGRFRSAVRPEV